MSFPRYPKYKPSGVEWLGDVPAHWDVTQLKRTVNPDRQITYGIVQAGPHVTDGVPYIRPADMTDEEGILAPEEVMRTSPEIAAGYSRSTIRTGDLVCSIGPSFGKVMVTPKWLDGANLTQGTARIATAAPHNAKFLFWILRSPLSVAQWESSVGGATFRALNLGPLAETTIPVPSESEQTRIAEFLDRETAKIDGLVAEQRRLMELLKEKRQAVISHAVTRGLNPNVPLKSSGIEWLSDVPVHWEIRKMSHFFRAGKGKNGQMLTKEFCGANPGDYPVYSGQTENEGVMGTWDQFEFDFAEKGVLFSTTVGAKAMHLRQLFGRFSLSQNCMIIWSTSDRCETRFYYYHFQPLFQFERSLIPEHMQASFRIEDLYGYKIVVLPTEEQSAITAHLDAETAKFDTLTAEAQRAIDLLQERRTALISAAVTGQIDVRAVASSG
jgi:type I restriction enzyme S subunit